MFGRSFFYLFHKNLRIEERERKNISGKDMTVAMSANANLHKAKNAKNDEFYTQLTDVSKELMHYKPHFKGELPIT